MTVSMDVVYEGSLRCDATHGPSGSSLKTDAPVDNQGKGESFSPTDLVATALGACMTTIMAITADRLGVDIKGTKVTVAKHMVADPERRIGKLESRICVPVSVDQASQVKLEAAAHNCPVMKSIDPRIETIVEFDWS